jgi:hypothetical protein
VIYEIVGCTVAPTVAHRSSLVRAASVSGPFGARCGGLENRCTSYWRTESSNLSPSANPGQSQDWRAISCSGWASRPGVGLPLKTAGGRRWGATTVAQAVAHHGASNPLRVVTADDGRPYLAEVIGQEGGSERVAPITGPRGVRTVTSRDVVDHWHKARSRQPGGGRPSCGDASA